MHAFLIRPVVVFVCKSKVVAGMTTEAQHYSTKQEHPPPPPPQAAIFSSESNTLSSDLPGCFFTLCFFILVSNILQAKQMLVHTRQDYACSAGYLINSQDEPLKIT